MKQHTTNPNTHATTTQQDTQQDTKKPLQPILRPKNMQETSNEHARYAAGAAAAGQRRPSPTTQVYVL